MPYLCYPLIYTANASKTYTTMLWARYVVMYYIVFCLLPDFIDWMDERRSAWVWSWVLTYVCIWTRNGYAQLCFDIAYLKELAKNARESAHSASTATLNLNAENAAVKDPGNPPSPINGHIMLKTMLQLRMPAKDMWPIQWVYLDMQITSYSTWDKILVAFSHSLCCAHQ